MRREEIREIGSFLGRETKEEKGPDLHQGSPQQGTARTRTSSMMNAVTLNDACAEPSPAS